MKRKRTILVVDDNPENLSILGTVLAESNRSLYFAKNGAFALNIVKKKHPDLILLDIMMPDMDGFEVCRQLKQDAKWAEIPIIFLTAKTEKDDVIAGLELGAVDYVTKPFNKKELLTRVNTHLELQAAKKDLQEALVEKDEALSTKDKLFSIIGHDLGNIFYGLQGLAGILVDKKPPLDVKAREKTFKCLSKPLLRVMTY